MLPLAENNSGFNFYYKGTQGKAISKSPLLYLIVVVIFASCNLIGGKSRPNYNRILLTTNGTQFNVKDSINVTLTNDSTSSINIGLLCSYNLTFYYQQKVNNEWSGPKWFHSYTMLGCATVGKTLKPRSTISNKILANSFDTTGTFRLGLSYSKTNNQNATTISNKFTITK